MKLTPSCALLSVLLLLSACGGGGEETSSSTPPTQTSNAAPVANAPVVVLSWKLAEELERAKADPAAAVAATLAREPILQQTVELERWKITAQYLGAPDTRSHGLGDILKRTLESQIDEVAEVFGLKAKPSADAVFHRAFLPPVADRILKA